MDNKGAHGTPAGYQDRNSVSDTISCQAILFLKNPAPTSRMYKILRQQSDVLSIDGNGVSFAETQLVCVSQNLTRGSAAASSCQRLLAVCVDEFQGIQLNLVQVKVHAPFFQ